MPVEVLGIDHVYIAVRSRATSEPFYDHLLQDALGFRKNHFELGGDPHIQYYNRQFGFVIRPTRPGLPADHAYGAGRHRQDGGYR